MSKARCTRKHTPITSRRQQRLFGYWHSHPKERPKSITAKEVKEHLSESKGERLPESASRRRRRKARLKKQ